MIASSPRICACNKLRRGMLLLSRRGKRMGKEEWRESSRQREDNVPAPGHLGSPSSSLPTGEKWKLLPGREAMTSRASAPCGVRCLPPPILREQFAGASSPHAEPRPLPPSGGRRWLARGPCHQAMPEDPSLVPEPRARSISTLAPSSHL